MQKEDEVIRKHIHDTAIDVIHQQHQREKQKSDSSDTASSHPTYDLIVDGYISIVLVTEIAVKYIMHREKDKTFNKTENCETFLREALAEPLDVPDDVFLKLEKTLTGLRDALAHSNMSYQYALEDTSTNHPMLILYAFKFMKMGKHHFEEVQRYTAEQFAVLCTQMRGVFLSWSPIAEVLKNQEPKIGARELYNAVCKE